MAKKPQPPKKSDQKQQEIQIDLPQEIAEQLKKEEAQGGGVVNFAASRTFSGPMPLASEYEHYERVHPGSAQALLKYALDEQTHRHKMDELIVKSEVAAEKKGINYGFYGFLAATCGAIALTIVLVILQAQAIAFSVPIALIGIPVLFTVRKFVDGRK